MKKSLLFIFFILISCKSNYTRIGDENANYIPYYLKVYEADSLYLVGNYKRSYEILDKLFKKYEPININGFYECGTYLLSCYKTNNNKKVKKNIKKFYENYGEVFYPSLKDSSFWDKMLIENILPFEVRALYTKNYIKNKNLQLRDTIIKLMKEDQFYILNSDNRNKIDSISEIHFRKINEIFLKYGYPSNKVIGYDGFFEKYATIQAILIHLSEKNKIKILPTLYNFLKKGSCLPFEYSSVEDRLYLERDYAYKYGVEERFRNAEIKFLDEQNIDSLRKSIGLPNLQYLEWRNLHIN